MLKVGGVLGMIELPKLKDFSGNLIRVKYLEDEVKYAQSQLQEHDTGHIHTAISWMKDRIKKLKGEDNE
jgi:hypothetical protein